MLGAGRKAGKMPKRELNFHIRINALDDNNGVICDIEDDVDQELEFTSEDAIVAYLYGAFTCAKLNGVSPDTVIELAKELSKTDFQNPQRVPVDTSETMVKA
jgi:hypothetical protein